MCCVAGCGALVGLSDFLHVHRKMLCYLVMFWFSTHALVVYASVRPFRRSPRNTYFSSASACYQSLLIERTTSVIWVGFVRNVQTYQLVGPAKLECAGLHLQLSQLLECCSSAAGMRHVGVPCIMARHWLHLLIKMFAYVSVKQWVVFAIGLLMVPWLLYKKALFLGDWKCGTKILWS